MTKAKKITYWISTVWLALGLVSTGIVQLAKIKTGAGGLDSLTKLGYPAYILTLLGIWKILAAVAVLMPGYRILKEWAYAGVFFLMTGALYSHIAMGESFKDIFPSVLLLALGIISWLSRPHNRKITFTTA